MRTAEVVIKERIVQQRLIPNAMETRAALAQELLSGRLRLPEAMVARFENAPIAVNA